jgi:hypothetical protein
MAPKAQVDPNHSRRGRDATAFKNRHLSFLFFFEVAHWDEIKDDLPKHFAVSPVAITPRPDEEGASFWTCHSLFAAPLERARNAEATWEAVQESVNDSTGKLAPTEPVQENVKVLPRLFHFMAKTVPFHGIHLGRSTDLTQQGGPLGRILAPAG